MGGGGGTPKSNPGLSPTPLALMEKHQVSLRKQSQRLLGKKQTNNTIQREIFFPFFEMHSALSAQKSPSVPHAQGPLRAGRSSNCMLTAVWH